MIRRKVANLVPPQKVESSLIYRFFIVKAFLLVYGLKVFNTTNNIHEKLFDSDWLRAGQFKNNTSAKGLTPMEITHLNCG